MVARQLAKSEVISLTSGQTETHSCRAGPNEILFQQNTVLIKIEICRKYVVLCFIFTSAFEQLNAPKIPGT